MQQKKIKKYNTFKFNLYIYFIFFILIFFINWQILCEKTDKTNNKKNVIKCYKIKLFQNLNQINYNKLN